jgi:hypothetical protein
MGWRAHYVWSDNSYIGIGDAKTTAADDLEIHESFQVGSGSTIRGVGLRPEFHQLAQDDCPKYVRALEPGPAFVLARRAIIKIINLNLLLKVPANG